MLAGLALLGALAIAPPASARRLPHRHGGRVQLAWPYNSHRGRPGTPLTRWLAKQVGPRKPRHGSRRHARIAAAVSATAAGGQVGLTAPTGQALQLIRSYAIPADDPSYDRLLNLSWTYDSAVGAAGFLAAGLRPQAEQVLDQLAALQRSDGSLDFAFDTYTGASIPLFRTGTIAWAGLAAAEYKAAYGSTRYDAFAYGVANWLLGRQVANAASSANGMLTGGPDVSWASTQHNLVAYAFLSSFAAAIDPKHDRVTFGGHTLSQAELSSFQSSYTAAAAKIAAGIDRRYVLLPDGSAYFEQGADDTVQPLDVQTLGILYLVARHRQQDAAKVRTFVDRNFALSGRSIVKSPAAASYNNSYAGAGPFTGYRPYAGPGAPDVMWTEGTIEMRVAMAALGATSSTLDQSLANWWGLTLPQGLGPLGADRTVTGNALNEYHVWPNAAAAGWTLLALADPSFLFG